MTDTGGYRGLILHWRRLPERQRGARLRHSSRALLGTLTGYGGQGGVCRWCERPTETKRTRWHKSCLSHYWVAVGRQNLWQLVDGSRLVHPLMPDGEPVPCAMCGDRAGEELDHRVALEVARLRGERALLRAFTIGNLQMLCNECHKVKTRDDVRLMADMRRGRQRMAL